MICNIDYIDPSNNQFILNNFNNQNNKNIKNDTTNIIKNMINNFNKKIELFCNHNNNNNYFIIIILFILFFKFIM